jgi:hypothetical protein
MMFDNQEAAASASSEALDRLVKRLYSQLDPVEGEPEWSALPDDDRHYYRELIEDLVGSPIPASTACQSSSRKESASSTLRLLGWTRRSERSGFARYKIAAGPADRY